MCKLLETLFNDAVFFGVSAHERTEIVARQTDVLEHGLYFCKVRTQCERRTRPYRTRCRHARRSGSAVTSSSTARAVAEEMQHPDTFLRHDRFSYLSNRIPTARRLWQSDVGRRCSFGSRRAVGSWVSHWRRSPLVGCTGDHDSKNHGTDTPCSFDWTTRPPEVCRSASLGHWSDAVWSVPCVRIPIPRPYVRATTPIRSGTRSLPVVACFIPSACFPWETTNTEHWQCTRRTTDTVERPLRTRSDVAWWPLSRDSGEKVMIDRQPRDLSRADEDLCSSRWRG